MLGANDDVKIYIFTQSIIVGTYVRWESRGGETERMKLQNADRCLTRVTALAILELFLPGGHCLLDFIELNYTVEVDGDVDIVWLIRSYLSWNKSTVWSLAGIISRWVSEVCEDRSWSIFDI
jgi:hypothetical protein